MTNITRSGVTERAEIYKGFIISWQEPPMIRQYTGIFGLRAREPGPAKPAALGPAKEASLTNDGISTPWPSWSSMMKAPGQLTF